MRHATRHQALYRALLVGLKAQSSICSNTICLKPVVLWFPRILAARGSVQYRGTMTLPDRLRLPLAFEPAALLRDLDGLSSRDWIAHFVKQNYDGDWSVLPLRAPAGARHPVMMIYSDPSATVFEDTPLLDLCPNIRSLLVRMSCELRSIRLMRLTPGSVIKEHSDPDLSAEEGTARIHIAIATNPGVEFELNRRRVVMEPGSAWYLRLSNPHRVANKGTTDRVHLVIDAVVNDWLRDLLARAAAQARTEPVSAGR